MADEELLGDLLIQWEETLEQGRETSAAELCVDCPHLLAEVARRIEALRRTPTNQSRW
jgi:serine/threonine-protein kinase